MVVPVLWGLLGVLALVLSYVTASAAFAWAGYLMLALLLFGQLATRICARGLTAARDLSADRVSFGGQVMVTVTVENRSRLPAVWVAAAEPLAAGLPVRGIRGRIGPMKGRSHLRFSYVLEGARRGYYEIAPTVLRTGDLLGLAHRELSGGGPTSSLTVFPKLIPIQHTRFPSRRPSAEVRARRRAFEDDTQVVGIRPYQHSDSLRRIHWRATAHTGRLQSKLFQVSAQAAATIVLDLRRAAYGSPPGPAGEMAELAICCAASLAHHLLDRRQPTGLLCLAYDPAIRPVRRSLRSAIASATADGEGETTGLHRIPFGRGREQLTAILSLLGCVRLGAAEGLGPALWKEQEQFPWGSLVIVITPQVDAELMRALLALRTSGLEVHVVLVSRAPSLSSQAALESIGIAASRLRQEEEIGGLGL
jgi:uncharacterized protein (DUF58 family)